MKKFVLPLLAASMFLTTSCGNKNADNVSTSEAQEVAIEKGEKFVAENAKSTIAWKAYHKGGMLPRWGVLDLANGEFTVDDSGITAGNFTIDMASIKADEAALEDTEKTAADLEGHLKNEDFFNVEKFPTATFEITNVADFTATTDEKTAAIEDANKLVSGNLTLLGNPLNVTFPAKITIEEGNAKFEARFRVNRADWGIKFGTTELDPADWMISKDIDITLDIVAKKAN